MSDDDNGFLGLDITKIIDSLKSIDSPLKFSALLTILLMIILILVFTRISPGKLQLTLVIAIIVAIIILAFVTLVYDAKRITLSKKTNSFEITYGVFIATPMDAMKSDREWTEHQRNIKDLSAALKTYCRIKNVYYAGDLYPQRKKWQTPDIALRENFKILKGSNKFIMIYPRKTSSSVLIEAGIALALGKDSVFFAKNPDELPFLLRRAANASTQDGLPHISIYRYSSFDEIIETVKKDGLSLFGEA